MAFVRLQRSLENSALDEQVGQSRRVKRAEEVDLEEEPVSHMVAVKGDTLYQRDMGDINSSFIIRIATIARRKCMINRVVQTPYGGADCSASVSVSAVMRNSQKEK